MRKLLFLLLVSFACIAKAGNKSVDQYVYLGTDTEITDSTTMYKLQLRKNSIVYVKGGVADTMKTIVLGIEKTTEFTFKPELKKGDKITQLFRKLPKSGKTVFSISFDGMNKWNEYKTRNPKSQIVAIVQLTGTQSIVFNKTSKAVDVYRDGSFVQQMVDGGTMVVDKPANGDIVNVVVASADAKYVPTVVTVKFGEVATGGVSTWLLVIIAIVALLLGAAIAAGVIYFIKKKKQDDKGKTSAVKKVDSNDFKFAGVKNVDNSFGNYAIKLGRGKDKHTIYLVQTVRLPDSRYLDNYVDDIVNKYYNGNKNIEKYIKRRIEQEAEVKNDINLPVKFNLDKQKNISEDEWAKVKVKVNNGKRTVWAKFIAPFVAPDPQVTATPQPVTASQPMSDCEAELSSQADRLAAYVPTVENLEEEGGVMPEKVKVSTADINSVCNSLRKIGQTVGKQIEQTKKACDEKLNSLKEKCAQDVQDAVSSNNKEWEAKTKTIQEERAEAVNKAKKLLADFTQEKTAKEEALGIIDELNRTIERKDKESKEYNSLLVFYRSCSEYAKLAVEVFDTVDAVENLATRLYNSYMDGGNDRDSFCYYMTRVSRKFLASTAKIKNLHDVYVTELRMLAATGLVPKGGWIDRLLESQKEESLWTEQLKAKLYRDVFEEYCGYVVVMADEYAYMMRNMVTDVDKAIEDEIAVKAEHLRKLVGKLGYKLVYARPFTPVTQYDSVENTAFVDLGIAKDTIVEIKKMAVAYGTKNPKTEVSVQQ